MAKVTSTKTLYQQIKAIAEADSQRLTEFKDDLYQHDRSALRNVRPCDQWLWFLRESGTTLVMLPLTQAAALLNGQEKISEYDPRIEDAIRTNRDHAEAVVSGQMLNSISVKTRAFHLVCLPDKSCQVKEIQPHQISDLVKVSRWKAFIDWRDAVIAKASQIKNEEYGDDSIYWWNLATLGWSDLDWLERYRAGEWQTDMKVYSEQVAREMIKAMIQVEEEGR